ncbi:hypothetical protein X797_005098 [Metarhizium robertsii]|uniref:Mmc protein n=1 Tax=Metarhizium robertsii TaxID=568076 RepID=A0A0A1UUX3_9HYPO|nr:hypothetical protein X797_005098 [Metarhizium robertsii]
MQTKALIFAAALVGSVVGQAPAPAPASVELGAGSSKAWEAPAPTAKPDHDWEHSSAASHEWHQASSSEAQHSWGSSADRHNATVVTKTKVVSRYTTYCPEPTTVEIGTKTYTVTKPTTLTITECPCTVTETHKKPPHTKEAPPPHTKEIPPPKPPVQTPGVPQPPPPAATTGVVVAGADGLTAAYGFAMAAAGLVGGVFAL